MPESIRLTTAFALVLTVACSGRPADDTPDSAAIAARADSLAAAERADAERMRSDARTTLAELLKDPATASFDSLVVVRPPPIDGRTAPMAACGRISGKPGLGGGNTATRFVYQSRFTVFVEEASNREEFAALWGRVCTAPGSTVFEEE